MPARRGATHLPFAALWPDLHGWGSVRQDAGMDEPVVSGRYVYVCDERPVPVEETFAIRHENRGVVVASVRSAPGTRLAVEAVHGAESSIAAELAWTSELGGTASAANLSYRWRGGRVEATGDVIAGEHHERRPVDVTVDAPGASFFPLMRVFSGRTLLRLLDATDRAVDVVTPDIRDPRDVERWLHPLVDHRRVGAAHPATLDVDGVERSCQVVDYLGGSYDQAATVWVDEGGLLLRYTWDQPGVGDWDVRLADITGEWPRPVDW
jgi:hypothetical protein